MTTPIADISKQILAMQDDLASALEAERVAKADLDEASHNFATQKKDVWEATGHYIRAQKRKLALSVTLRERQVETTRVAERTEEVLRENGDLQRKLEGLGGEEEVDASLFVRHLLGLRRVLKSYQKEYDVVLARSSLAKSEAAVSEEALGRASSKLDAALSESSRILGFITREKVKTDRLEVQAEALGKGIAAATTRRKAAHERVQDAETRLSELEHQLEWGVEGWSDRL
ncbi:hypothetical protein TrCOL_g560 [Triparma columacea]|uniref:Uncharacterized protein n=1 Tax=Triparma columacea TaxID=722753 RepID=A0A9W7LCX5_9STRA|nr:hypothetical protein TrCOL_g560 [Triparma columacea]